MKISQRLITVIAVPLILFIGYMGYTHRNLIIYQSGINNNKSYTYWLERSDPQGSGGYISYTLYRGKNGEAKSIFREEGLYQGSVELTKNDTELVTTIGYPRENDPNSSPSRMLKKHYSINGESVKFEREEIVEKN